MTFDEATFRSVISGQSTGLIATLLRAILLAATIPYGLTVLVRNVLFDKGWKPIHRAAVPVISVGNITTGGTGKTPVVAMVVNTLLSTGKRPAIVSRGYRADAGGTNDELKVLEQLCPGVPHLQNADRVASVNTLLADASADVIVMDDGFQHRRLHRDLNILLIDASNPFGFGRLLPGGLLREPLSSMKRADLVIITRADLVSRETVDAIRHKIALHAPGLSERICAARFAPSSLMSITGDRYSLNQTITENLIEHRVYLMSGIGNPDGFEQTCRQAGFDIAGRSWFPDHHHYTRQDITTVTQAAQNVHASAILTTQKDLVKLAEICQANHFAENRNQNTQRPAELKILALTIELQFLSERDRTVLDRLLEQGMSAG